MPCWGEVHISLDMATEPPDEGYNLQKTYILFKIPSSYVVSIKTYLFTIIIG